MYIHPFLKRILHYFNIPRHIFSILFFNVSFLNDTFNILFTIFAVIKLQFILKVIYNDKNSKKKTVHTKI